MRRRLALLIATDQYQDVGLQQLTSPVHDVESLAAVLGDNNIAGFEVETLINEPTGRVGEAIGELYLDRRSDDLTLLYFSGHGLKDENGQLYLAMVNTKRDNLRFTSLPAQQISDVMGECASQQKVLILDCCYSGAFPADRAAKADTAVQTLEHFGGRARYVLTASDATRYAFQGNQVRGEAARSVFTRYLVEGLRDGSADRDNDGDITLDELYYYVHDHVVKEMPQQRPKRIDTVEGSIIIAKNLHWSLPQHVRSAIDSPIAEQRSGALKLLDDLYRRGNDIVRRCAKDELEILANDDSRSVATAAAEQLQRILKVPEHPRVRASAPPLNRESIKGQNELVVADVSASIITTLPELNYFRAGDFKQVILQVDTELYCVKFSPDRSVIAAGSEEAALVWSLPATEGHVPTRTLPHPSFVYSVAFALNGRRLVTGCQDNAVRFWDWSSEELIKEDRSAHDDSVYAVALSGDGRHLATGGYDNKVNLWILDGDEFQQLDSRRFGGRVSSLAFPGKGDLLSIGTQDDRIHLWNLVTGEVSELGTHKSSVECVTFSSDGKLLASCGLDKMVCLWDVDTKTRKWASKTHDYVVKSVAFSPDDKVIASASWDCTVRLWDVSKGRVGQRIPWWGTKRMRWHSDWIWSTSFSRDGGMIASAGSDGMIVLWTIGEQSAPPSDARRSG